MKKIQYYEKIMQHKCVLYVCRLLLIKQIKQNFIPKFMKKQQLFAQNQHHTQQHHEANNEQQFEIYKIMMMTEL